MNLNAFVLFMLGILLEILWLWDDAHGQKGGQIQAIPHLAWTMRPIHWAQAGLTLAAGLLVGVFSLLRVSRAEVSLDNPLVGIIFVALGLFVLGAGVVTNGLLPRVNEQSILVTQLLVLINTLISRSFEPIWGVIFLVGLPAVLSCGLVLNRRGLHPLGKSGVYLWYLVCLLILTFQSGGAEVFSASRLTLVDAYLAGITFIFILLHSLFLIRFFLIVSCLVLPRNRPLVTGLMPRLFSDDQVAPRRFLSFAVGLVTLVLLNAWLDWLPRAVMLNLAVIACVQFFFKPRPQRFA